ncbi:hypothetical protein ACLIA0_07960 [Bacillaceae bacterium W0354]
MNLANWTTENIILFIFCLILLSDHIGAIIEFRKVNEAMKDIKDDDLEFSSKVQKYTILFIGAVIFKWLIYVIAYVFIEHFLILIVGGILVLLRIYVMVNMKEKQPKPIIDFLVLIGETAFIAYFIIHYFVFRIGIF